MRSWIGGIFDRPERAVEPYIRHLAEFGFPRLSQNGDFAGILVRGINRQVIEEWFKRDAALGDRLIIIPLRVERPRLLQGIERMFEGLATFDWHRRKLN